MKYGLLVFLGGCSFGILSTFVKLSYSQGFSLGEVTGSQFLFGFLMVWILALFSKKQRLSLKQILVLIVSGTTIGTTGLLYYQSLQYVEASFAIILLFQFIWIGLLFEFLFDKVKPTRRKLLAVLLLLGGSLIASGVIQSNSGSVVPIEGVIWGLLAAISFAAFIYLSGRVGRTVHPILKSAYMSTGGAIIVLFIFPPFFLFNGALQEGLLSYGILLAFFGVFLPPILFSIGMPKVGSGLGTILSASELPMAVFMSMLILNETVTFIQWSGVIVILIGIAIGNRVGRTRETVTRKEVSIN
ncbi:EamA family transporter [Bacillus sp. FJAT-45350]|uniref:EamA family transporter n=1 Tax=Bacillus sp. FJAT-45350 TaxID=2011014 RepID=UPI00211B86B0|nr:DMT family transporter [Bacillus sp. FJAT-45350]